MDVAQSTQGQSAPRCSANQTASGITTTESAAQYAGHLVGWHWYCSQQDVIQYRRGSATDGQSGIQVRLGSSQTASQPRQQIEQVALGGPAPDDPAPLHQPERQTASGAPLSGRAGRRWSPGIPAAGYAGWIPAARRRRPRARGFQPESQRELLAERMNMPTEKWSRLESTKRMTMAPSCCSPKGEHHQRNAEVAGVAKHGGQDQWRGPIYLLELEQGEQQAGQQDHQGTGPTGQGAPRDPGVFHQGREKTSAGVKSSILARLT